MILGSDFIDASSMLECQLGGSHLCMPLQNGASFLGNITSILQSQQQEVASLLQGPTPTATTTSQPVLPALPAIRPSPTPVPQPVLPALPTLPTASGGRRLQQAQVGSFPSDIASGRSIGDHMPVPFNSPVFLWVQSVYAIVMHMSAQ